MTHAVSFGVYVVTVISWVDTPCDLVKVMGVFHNKGGIILPP